MSETESQDRKNTPGHGESAGNSIGPGPAEQRESRSRDAPLEEIARAATRRLEANQRLLRQGFLHVPETGEYHWRDHAETGNQGRSTVAFKDHGNRLSAEGEDKMTVEGLLALAEQKGWTSVQVSGTENFRRSVWRAAQESGTPVTGYQPTPLDVALAHEKRVRAGIESSGAPAPSDAPAPRSAQEVREYQESRSFQETARAIRLLSQGREKGEERYDRARDPAFESGIRREILNRYAARRDIEDVHPGRAGEDGTLHERQAPTRARTRA
jgi:hypothetical protein